MLKIKDEVDLNILKKYGFRLIQQDKRINYIYMPNEAYCNCGNSITVYNDTNLFNMDRYIGDDRLINFRFNECASWEFNKTMDVLFNLIEEGLVEKVSDNIKEE